MLNDSDPAQYSSLMIADAAGSALGRALRRFGRGRLSSEPRTVSLSLVTLDENGF